MKSVRYIKHGVIFSIMMSGYPLLLPLVQWIVAYDLTPLTFEPLLILLLTIYIFVGVFILIGGINSSICRHLWTIDTSNAWQDLLGKGTIMFLLLCFIQLPAALVTTLLTWMQPGGTFSGFWHALPAVLLPSILITPIPNGVVGRYVESMGLKDSRTSE